MSKLEIVRRHVVLASVGAGLLLTGVGVGAAAVVSSPGTAPASDESPVVVDDPVVPSATATASEPSASPTAPTATATVTAVTTPEQPPAPAVQPTPVQQQTEAAQDTSGVGKYDPETGYYTPAPDGAGTVYAPMPPFPHKKLPGEPGYDPSVDG